MRLRSAFADQRRRPGIQFRALLWIPGSLASLAPRNDGEQQREKRMSNRLKGKRAFVTAGAVGIGRACATAFAREGATVFATDIDEKGLALLAKDGVSEVARLDVRDTAAVGEMAKRAGPIDILLNAAGFVHN